MPEPAYYQRIFNIEVGNMDTEGDCIYTNDEHLEGENAPPASAVHPPTDEDIDEEEQEVR